MKVVLRMVGHVLKVPIAAHSMVLHLFAQMVFAMLAQELHVVQMLNVQAIFVIIVFLIKVAQQLQLHVPALAVFRLEVNVVTLPSVVQPQDLLLQHRALKESVLMVQRDHLVQVVVNAKAACV